jgi:thiol:disulfide interchange protein
MKRILLSLRVAFCLLVAVATGCSRNDVQDRARSDAGPAVAGQPTERTTAKTGNLDGTAESSPRFAFYTVDHYDDARDAAADLAMTLERAKLENKRVLVQVGGDWCGWCKRMTAFIETNDNVRQRVSDHFLLMKVTYDENQKNEAFLAGYPKISGYPHLFVLDADGTLLHSQDTAKLEEGKGYNEEVVVEFLEKWKAEL